MIFFLTVTVKKKKNCKLLSTWRKTKRLSCTCFKFYKNVILETDNVCNTKPTTYIKMHIALLVALARCQVLTIFIFLEYESNSAKKFFTSYLLGIPWEKRLSNFCNTIHGVKVCARKVKRFKVNTIPLGYKLKIWSDKIFNANLQLIPSNDSSPFNFYLIFNSNFRHKYFSIRDLIIVHLPVM